MMAEEQTEHLSLELKRRGEKQKEISPTTISTMQPIVTEQLFTKKLKIGEILDLIWTQQQLH